MKKPGTKVVQLDLGNKLSEPLRNSVVGLPLSTMKPTSDEASSQMYRTLNAYPESKNNITNKETDVFISELERESDRMVESMVMSDRLVGSVVLECSSKSPTRRGPSIERSLKHPVGGTFKNG